MDGGDISSDESMNGFFERIPRHLIVTSVAWVSRVLVALTQIIAVRFLLQSLGEERYAVFAVLTGLLNWFMLVDLGLGYSLQNFVAEEHAPEDIRQFIGAAAVAACALWFSSGLCLVLVCRFFGNFLLGEFPFLSSYQRALLFFISGLLMMSTAIGGIVYKIWYGQHRGYLSHIMPGAASLLALILLYLSVGAGTNAQLSWILTAFLAPPAVIAVLSFVTEAWRSRAMWPSYRVVRKLSKRAIKFFLFAMLAAAVLQVDYIVISQRLPPAEIVTYAIGSRMFLFISLFYSSALSALWPVFTRQTQSGEWRAVFSEMHRYMAAGGAFVIVATLLVWLSKTFILKILAPKQAIAMPTSFVVLLGIYYLFRIWSDTHAIVLQSCSELRPLWVLVPLQAVISVVAQWKLAPVFGVNGIVVGLILSYLLTVCWGLPLSLRRLSGEHA
jgi:O-antigen/teichoic acid export membrane protein